jgi:hypothetical protein
MGRPCPMMLGVKIISNQMNEITTTYKAIANPTIRDCPEPKFKMVFARSGTQWKIALRRLPEKSLPEVHGKMGK